MATCSKAPLPLFKARHRPKLGFDCSVWFLEGRKRCPLLPAPEKEDEQMLALDAIATNLTKPGKKLRRPLVPMTDEEQEKILSLKEKRRSGSKYLHDLVERRMGLLKLRDELWFRRRCLAACAVNRIILLRHDATYVNHKRLLSTKVGDPMLKELQKDMQHINLDPFIHNGIGSAMEIVMDAFLDKFKKNMDQYLKEVETETDCDQNGALLKSEYSCSKLGS